MEAVITHRIRSTVFVSVAVLIGTTQLVFAQQDFFDCSRFMGSGSFGWWWLFGPLTMLVFLALGVAVVVLIVRAMSSGQSAKAMPLPGSGSSPLDILKERFARGEIDQEEYEQRREVLDRGA